MKKDCGQSQKNTKFFGCIISYGDVPDIGRVIESMGDMPIFVFNTTKSWLDVDMPDKTRERVKGYKNVKLLRAEFKGQAHVLTFAKAYAYKLGFYAMIILDADEVIDDIEKLKTRILEEECDAWACQMIEYAEDGKTQLIRRKYAPIVAVRCDDHEHSFYEKRCYNGEKMKVIQDVTIHHYSLANEKDKKYKLNEGYGEPLWSLDKEKELHKDG